jgi:predicted nucleic acid-binding protein
MIVVSNATPLISLAIIKQLRLLQTLYSQVHIPPAVYEEVVIKGGGRVGAKEVAEAKWIVVADLPETVRGTLQPRPLALHAGEVETIELAMGLEAGLVILDEKLARKVAKGQGLNVIGTVGILKYASQRGLLSDLKGALDALRAEGIRIGDKVYREVLRL